jgi:hypothetical protein
MPIGMPSYMAKMFTLITNAVFHSSQIERQEETLHNYLDKRASNCQVILNFRWNVHQANILKSRFTIPRFHHGV